MSDTKDLAITSRIFQILLLAIFIFSVSYHFDLGNMKENLGCSSYGLELIECETELSTFMVRFFTPYVIYTMLLTLLTYVLIFTSLSGFGTFIGAIFGIILQVFAVAAFGITIYELTISKAVAAIMRSKGKKDATN